MGKKKGKKSSTPQDSASTSSSSMELAIDSPRSDTSEYYTARSSMSSDSTTSLPAAMPSIPETVPEKVQETGVEKMMEKVSLEDTKTQSKKKKGKKGGAQQKTPESGDVSEQPPVLQGTSQSEIEGAGKPSMQQQQKSPQQQQGGPPQQQQRGSQQQQQRGPQQQQQRGPQKQQQQQQRGPQQQQRGPQQGPPPGFNPPSSGPLPTRGSQQGPPAGRQWGPPPHQQQIPPPQHHIPPPQQQMHFPPQQQMQFPPQQRMPPPQSQMQVPPTQQQYQQPSTKAAVPQKFQPQPQPISGRQRGGVNAPQQTTPPSRQPQQPLQQQMSQGAAGDAPLPGTPMKPKSSSSGEMVPFVDPKRTAGTKGRRIVVETNHFPLLVDQIPKEAYHYDVDIDPDKPKRMMRKVMELFRAKYYPKNNPAFDGVKNLYSAKVLPFQGECLEGTVSAAEDEVSREREYKVKVKLAAKVDLTVLKEYVKYAGKNQGYSVNPLDAIHCIDVVLRNAPALYLTPVGRSFFSPPSGQVLNLGSGMEMWYGFYQSAVLGWKPFLNVDLVHKAFPAEQHIVSIIEEFCGCKAGQVNMDDRNFQYYLNDAEKFIKGLKIQYELPNNHSSRRTSRVNGFSQFSASKQMFDLEGGERISIANYFQKHKKIALKFPNLPCLWVGSKERHVYFPAEYCLLIRGQVTQRKMTPEQTRLMIKESATSTTVRKKRIMEQFLKSNHKTDKCVQEFGIKIVETFEKVNARVLDPPSLSYVDRGQKEVSVKVSKGVWRSNFGFYKSSKLTKWTILILDRVYDDCINSFVSMMISTGRQLGMGIGDPVKPFRKLERIPYRREKEELNKEFRNFKQQNIDLVVCVIPDFNNMYSYVKQASELAIGCLTQCILKKTMQKINPSTVGNILLKINAKLNGVNHILSRVCRPSILCTPVMIMGADVTHPPPESQDRPSVAAVTASHDPMAFKYNICWRLQPPKEEMIVDLEAIVMEQLKYFYKFNNGQKPQKIIFYRDGVSEGQFEYVRQREINAIRSACSKIQQEKYEPAITFFVVQKRHHTRFFPTRPEDSDDRNLNVPAGTCVDTMITHPTASDFYLVSHASIQGVAKPTKYRTLWDDNNMTEDDIEQLTYYLCHMFSRCNRSVSYPAPTYYAHLAAARANVYFETEKVRIDQLENEQKKKEILLDIRQKTPMFFV